MIRERRGTSTSSRSAKGPTALITDFASTPRRPSVRNTTALSSGSFSCPKTAVRGATILSPGAFIGAPFGGERRLYRHVARAFIAEGIAAALIEPPLHQHRAPPGEISGHNLLHGDVFTYARGMAQAVRDVRATLGWLLASYGPAGYWGLSLGAFTGTLLCPQEARLAFAVLVEPPTRREALGDSPLTRTWAAQLLESGLNDEDVRRATNGLRPNDPPAVAADHILLQAGRWDRLAPAEGVRELRERWGRPDVIWYDHGHISLPLLRNYGWIADGVRFSSERVGRVTEPTEAIQPA